MGAGPRALTDSLTARPGRSLRSRSGGREGGGAGFPAGGAEPALEKEEEEKGGKGGSRSHGPECEGPRRASWTPGGAAGRGETAGPKLWVSTLEGGHKTNFFCGIGGRLSLFAPSVLFRAPLFRSPASFPPGAWPSQSFPPLCSPGRPGLAWVGGLRGAGRAFRGAGEPARPQALPGAPSPTVGRGP